MESLFSSLKTERTARKVYRTRNVARADMMDTIERFTSPIRRHSTVGSLNPVEFERQAVPPYPAAHETGCRPLCGPPARMTDEPSRATTNAPWSLLLAQAAPTQCRDKRHTHRR